MPAGDKKKKSIKTGLKQQTVVRRRKLCPVWSQVSAGVLKVKTAGLHWAFMTDADIYFRITRYLRG